MTADDHRCELLTNDAGEVVARVRVSPDLGEDGRRALLAMVEAVQRLAEDPEVVEAQGRRQAEAVARIRARVRQRRDPS